MAMASVGNLGVGAAGASSGTTVTVTTAATLTAGNIALLAVSANNITTTDGVSTDHASVTDSSGAVSWTKVYEYTNGEGSAAAGCTTSLWYRPRQGSNLASASAIDITFGSSIADRLASDGWTKGISDWDHFASRIAGVDT